MEELSQVTRESARRWADIMEIFAEFADASLRDSLKRSSSQLWDGYHICKYNGPEKRGPSRMQVLKPRRVLGRHDIYLAIERNLGGSVGN